MSASLDSLIKTVVRSDIVAIALGVLESFEFPITNYTNKSPARALIESNAETVLELASVIKEVAKSGFGKLAKGEWLDLFLDQFYGDSRHPAEFAKLELQLTNASLSSVVVGVGDLEVSPDGGLHVFKNTTGGTLDAPDGSTLKLEFEALEAGAAYNLFGGTWSFVSDLPGVAIEENLATSVLQYGIDAETDAQAYTRASETWGTLATGGSSRGVARIAKEASTEVKKVLVIEAFPTPSYFTVVLASDTGGVSADAVTAVDDQLKATGEDLKPLCSHQSVLSATEQTITISGTAYVLAAELEAVKADYTARLLEYKKNLPIGPFVSREKIIGFITDPMSDDQKNDLDLASPNDTTVSGLSVAVFDDSGLNWVAV